MQFVCTAKLSGYEKATTNKKSHNFRPSALAFRGENNATRCTRQYAERVFEGKDVRRTSTVRLIQTAIKDRDIAHRGAGKDPVTDDEIMQI